MGSHGKWDDYDITFMIMVIVKHIMYHKPKFGLATKAKACKGADQKGSLGVISHTPESVGKCEGMNLHISK
jgi:hypothetical protein